MRDFTLALIWKWGYLKLGMAYWIIHPLGRVYILKFTLGRSDGLMLWGCAAKSLSWTFGPVSDQKSFPKVWTGRPDRSFWKWDISVFSKFKLKLITAVYTADLAGKSWLKVEFSLLEEDWSGQPVLANYKRPKRYEFVLWPCVPENNYENRNSVPLPGSISATLPIFPENRDVQGSKRIIIFFRWSRARCKARERRRLPLVYLWLFCWIMFEASFKKLNFYHWSKELLNQKNYHNKCLSSLLACL